MNVKGLEMSVRISLSLLIILVSFGLVHAQSIDVSSAHIKGTVFDWTGALVPNVKVVLETARLKKEFVTNYEGVYEGKLRPGIYTVTTRAPGFCHAQRAEFRVQQSSVIVMNLTLSVCGIALVIITDKSGKSHDEDRYIDPFQQESFRVSTTRLNLVIRYAKRLKEKRFIEYSGPKAENAARGVTVTYDLLTISADKIRFNNKTIMLEADGNVHIEDGKQLRKFEHAEISFKTTNPIATLKGR